MVRVASKAFSAASTVFAVAAKHVGKVIAPYVPIGTFSRLPSNPQNPRQFLHHGEVMAMFKKHPPAIGNVRSYFMQESYFSKLRRTTDLDKSVVEHMGTAYLRNSAVPFVPRLNEQPKPGSKSQTWASDSDSSSVEGSRSVDPGVSGYLDASRILSLTFTGLHLGSTHAIRISRRALFAGPCCARWVRGLCASELGRSKLIP